VDVLYAGTTEQVTDTPQLGLYTAAAADAGVVTTSVLQSGGSGASAGQGGRVTAELRMPSGGALVSMKPEMPPGARSLEVRLLRPDGSREVLLWATRMRPEWPVPYIFTQPVSLPSGSVLQATAYVDAPVEPAATPFTIAVNHYPTEGRR